MNDAPILEYHSGTKVVYDGFPQTADLLFEKTLEKRRLTAEAAGKSFEV